MSPFLRRPAAGSSPGAVKSVTPRRPHAGILRRERRALQRARAEALRDIGGLVVEMYRRAAFREEPVFERSAVVLGIDARLAEIDDLLHVRRHAPRCECGATILHSSRFCPNCGRTLDSGDADPADKTVVVSPER